MNVQAFDWIGSGGAFLVIGLEWVLSAGTFLVLSLRWGTRHSAEGEGCLMAILAPLLALAGGAAGLYLAPYPQYLVTSGVGCVALPALVLGLLARRAVRRG